MKLKNNAEDIIKYFKSKGFEHEIKKQPMIVFNQLINKKDKTGFIFLYLFDQLTFQNQNGSILTINKDVFVLEYSGKSLFFQHGKMIKVSLNVEMVKELK